jgi:opacity protein-like surface antigen
MKRRTTGILVVLCTLTAAPVAHAESTGQVNFFLGTKFLDSGDWDPVDDQGEFGVVMTFGRPDWPVHIAADLLGSTREAEIVDPTVGERPDATGSTFELDLGVRKIWLDKAVHPYAGGGLTLVRAEVEIDSSFETFNTDDDGVGAWLGGGIFWRLGKRFNIGADVRWSTADVEFEAGPGEAREKTDAGGLHAGLLLGFGW